MNLSDIKLGQKVNYLRLNEKGEAVTGEGVVMALLLNTERRPVVRVKDGDKDYNIDVVAINTTEEEQKAYIAHIEKIREKAGKINENLRQLQKEGQKEIDDLNTSYMGPAVTL